jgi:LysR family transcriptional regulator AphB
MDVIKDYDLNDMIIFIKVVKYQSFTLAANELNLPKSNISRKITRLEQNIGVRLLERSTRSLHLTEIGQIFYQHCLRIQEEVMNAEHSIEAMTTVASGTLRLCCSIGIGQELLAPLLGTFKQQYPLINIEIELSNRRVDIINEGFDLVVRVGESSDSNLISKKLLTVGMHLYASTGYLTRELALGNSLQKLEDLVNHQCLYMTAIDGKPRWQLFDNEQSQFIDIVPSVMINDFTLLRNLAMQDGGITLLPGYFVENKSTSLVPVLPQYVGRNVNIYAVYASRKGMTPKLRAFIDFLTEQLSSFTNTK